MALTTLLANTPVSIGDGVRISQKIAEGDKERIQHFEGVIIAIKGGSGERTVTVRRIGAGGIGIEKILPVDLPSIAAVKVLKRSAVRRSKLYFLRERAGKSALLLKKRSSGTKKKALPAVPIKPTSSKTGGHEKRPRQTGRTRRA